MSSKQTTASAGSRDMRKNNCHGPCFGDGDLQVLCLTTVDGRPGAMVYDTLVGQTKAMTEGWIRAHGKGAELQQLKDAAKRRESPQRCIYA